jgi:predicted DNA-binding transcriptional regulator YafY
MNPLERIYRIDYLLRERQFVSARDLREDLGVSPAQLKRDLETMRSRFHAPIEWNRESRGYHLVEQGKYGPRYQLPGLWFNSTEIQALLTMQHLVENVEPGLLSGHLKPLRDRLHALLDSTDHSAEEIQRRIRILHIASRKNDLKCFQIVATGVLKRKRLHLEYFVRDRNEVTVRDVSPQRLVHYRDNWYLDTWCHLRNDLRSFAVDAIQNASLLSVRAKAISEQELDNHLASGYGIYSGKETEIATLRFTPQRARWISKEEWHPKQLSRTEDDGSYVLEFPFSNDRELLGDILRYGPEVEVVGPESLRHRVIEHLQLSAKRYQ